MVTLEEVRNKQIEWFSSENKRFFGDLSYSVFNDKEGNVFLIRKTNAWTDMFDGIKKAHYRINKIDKKTLIIGDLYERVFNTLEECKNFLKNLEELFKKTKSLNEVLK